MASTIGPAPESHWDDLLSEWDMIDPGKRGEIIERVRANLNADAADVWVEHAVDAATQYVTIQTERLELGLPGDSLTITGLVVFATRLYLDAFAANGAQVAYGDPGFEPVFQPEDLYTHVHHYFDHLQLTFGIA